MWAYMRGWTRRNPIWQRYLGKFSGFNVSQQGNIKSTEKHTGHHTLQEPPRSIEGCYQSWHPMTEQDLKYYPYKDEMTVDGIEVPLVNDALHAYYWPKTPSPNDLVRYTAEKQNRNIDEVAQEVLRRKRLKEHVMAVLRVGSTINGRTPHVDSPDGGEWVGQDRLYREAVLNWYRQQEYGYLNYDLNPWLLYSSTYGLGMKVDFRFHTTVKMNKPSFWLIYPYFGKMLPRVRIPGVEGMPKEPISHIEPSMFHEIVLEMSIAAQMMRKEGYTTEGPTNPHAQYLASIIHFYPSPVAGAGITWDNIDLPINLDIAEEWLEHYKANVHAQNIHDHGRNMYDANIAGGGLTGR